MHTGYRFTLEKGSRKHLCPDCGKKTFVRYIDIQTGDYLPEMYGRCDREIKCRYFNPPPVPEAVEIKCLLTPFCKIEDFSTRAFRLTRQGKIHFIPKSMVFEVIENGCYVSEWYLQNAQRPPESFDNNCRYYVKKQMTEAPKSLSRFYKVLQNVSTEPAFIPKDILQQTLQGYEQNIFLQNLLTRLPFPLDKTDVEKVTALYYLGTVCNGYRAGAITFPFIDIAGNVRTVQVKQFDETNHTTGTDFLHSIIEKHHQRKVKPLPEWLQAYSQNEIKVSCLFGEHLLRKYTLNPVALVEAPKNAIYGTLYFGFPEQSENLLWLAVYNLSSLNFEKCKALQGRDVYLFPDLSKDGAAFQVWSRKAKDLIERMPGTRFEVSDLLENLAPTEFSEKGSDIADVLTGLDWKQVRELWRKAVGQIMQVDYEKHEIYEAPEEKITSAFEPSAAIIQTQESKPDLTKLNIQNLIKPEIENWEQEVIELETYFAAITLPQQPVKPNHYYTITNLSVFLESHFTTIKANNGKRTFLPFLTRLKDLKHYLTLNS